MDPIPETTAALEAFGPFLAGDDDLLELLTDAAALVHAVVPSLVGLSYAVLDEGLSFTLTASVETKVVDVADDGSPVPDPAGPVDEATWVHEARATAESGVASTLTLPICDDGRVVAAVDLYASAARAFEDPHRVHLVACVFGAWVDGAVTNADLGFETRRASRRALRVLQDDLVISQALGALLVSHGLDSEAAHRYIDNAATSAGIDPIDFARHLLRCRNRDRDQRWEGE